MNAKTILTCILLAAGITLTVGCAETRPTPVPADHKARRTEQPPCNHQQQLKHRPHGGWGNCPRQQTPHRRKNPVPAPQKGRRPTRRSGNNPKRVGEADGAHAGTQPSTWPRNPATNRADPETPRAP